MIFSSENPLIRYDSKKFPTASLIVADFDGTVTNSHTGVGDILGFDEIAVASIGQVLDNGALRRWHTRPPDSQLTPDSSFADTISYLVPDATPQERVSLTQCLVDVQVEQLLSQVGRSLPDGSSWPKLIPGFVECWSAITKAKEEKDRVLNTAILSRGYEPFISATIAHFGIEPPDFLIAHEQITSTHYHNYIGDEVGKGSGLQLNTIIHQWMLSFGITVFDDIRPRPDQVTLIGDTIRDVQEAKSIGANVILIDQQYPERAWQAMARVLKLGEISIAGSNEN